ncbi:MAG: hypothetical protein U0271_01930 [Polyangiaceae bacterium]
MTNRALVALVGAAALAGCAAPHDAEAPQPTSSSGASSSGTSSSGASSATSAAPTSATSAASSPEVAWQDLLAAMRAGEPLEPYATVNGIRSLEAGVHGESRATTFARWGTSWQSWEVRWVERTDTQARANLGPEVKEHGLLFVRTPSGWKLDRWQPGE